MKTAMQDTSVSAYRGIPVKKLATQADRICMLVEGHWKIWKEAVSLNEIKKLHQSVFGDIELSTIAARVNALVAAKVSIHPLRPGR